jgi:hypothetical protein
MVKFGICSCFVHEMSSAARVARTRLTVRFVFWGVVSRVLRDS